MITILLEKILAALTQLLGDIKTKLNTIKDNLDDLIVVATATGPIASFTTTITKPLISFIVDIPESEIGTDTVMINYVDFNQLVVNGNFADTSTYNFNIGTGSAADNVLTFTSGTGNRNYISKNLQTNINNHKYIVRFDYKSNVNFNYQKYGIGGTLLIPSKTDWTSFYDFVPGDGLTSHQTIYLFNYSDFTVGDWILNLRNFEIFDLTMMFGESIADYIFSLSTDEAITLFNQILYKDYYSYNAGGSKVSLASVNNDDTASAVVNLPETVYGGEIDITDLITPEIKAINGVNNIFTDSGNVTVEYLKLYKEV